MQDEVEVKARELLAAEIRRGGKFDVFMGPDISSEAAVRAIAAALRQKTAPVDLEQFREACHWMKAHGSLQRCAEADRLLSIIDNAGKVGAGNGEHWTDYCHRTGSNQGGFVIDPAIIDSPKYAAQREGIARLKRASEKKELTNSTEPILKPAPVVDDAMVERFTALVNDWRLLDGHAATPEADEMRQSCADELDAALLAAHQQDNGDQKR